MRLEYNRNDTRMATRSIRRRYVRAVWRLRRGGRVDVSRMERYHAFGGWQSQHPRTMASTRCDRSEPKRSQRTPGRRSNRNERGLSSLSIRALSMRPQMAVNPTSCDSGPGGVRAESAASPTCGAVGSNVSTLSFVAEPPSWHPATTGEDASRGRTGPNGDHPLVWILGNPVDSRDRFIYIHTGIEGTWIDSGQMENERHV
jgi:hypothetical protein